MVINISDPGFRSIISDKFFDLPRRWNGDDFYLTVTDLFEKYIAAVGSANAGPLLNKIEEICNTILKSIKSYLNGCPGSAYETLSKVLNILMDNPIKIYQKSNFGWAEPFKRSSDPLKLFRVRNVQNNTLFNRSDVFHTPYHLRSKVASCRYSIAGYPSLYLGTSLELCCEETKIESLKDLRLAARFELVRELALNENRLIKVIEFAIKPQDFRHDCYGVAEGELNSENMRFGGTFDEFKDQEVRTNYLLWYPLIASCSFIRINKGDPFAAEYIIPQLFMQWIRKKSKKNELYGIRYFSCASIRTSEMGFNYMFPVSGKEYAKNRDYCSILANAFKLTIPRFVHEYKSITECEEELIRDRDVQAI